MKILVTGGTGYIGSHIATELLNLGYEVLIFDNLSNSSISTLKGIEEITHKKPIFFRIDLCDEKKVYDIFKNNQDIDAVIHLAALKAVGESVKRPLLYYHNNLISSINILRAMEKNEINNFIYSSSACVYGDPQYLPIDEKHPLSDKTNPYGRTKGITEEILKHITDVNKNFNVTSLRYFNPIGAHKSALIGEEPKGVPENLVPYLNQVVSGVLPHLRIFGNDYETIDGTGVRDYIHILDLVDAHIASLNRMTKIENIDNFEIFNIGTGRGTSVLELVKLFEEATGEKVPYKFYPKRPGDIATIYNDVKLAKSKLGWKTQFTIKEALIDGWNWEKRLRENKKK